MTATIPFTKPVSQIKLAPGSKVTISDISWSEFESVLRELGENRSARLSYSPGTLEVMVPFPEHARPKELISDLVKILLTATSQ